jgi:GGDEF domain-containing protein
VNFGYGFLVMREQRTSEGGWIDRLGIIATRSLDGILVGSVEHREMQAIILACMATLILASGVALLIYPVVFSQPVSAHARTIPVGFFGFCVLSVLLTICLIDRQATIRRLREQIGEERSRSAKVLRQANADLLKTVANFSLFQDQLLREFQRAAVGKQSLSVLVITTRVHEELSEPSLSSHVLGKAAKAISQTLREQDSIYILTHGHFGVILPGVDALVAKRVSARLVERLTDAAGASNRFSFKIDAISYPEQTSSAHDLELAVTQLLPKAA